uniref:Uncharacterized protein n=1 Tax=Tanacetum cinerariifolium TaxID=118510 RepID=A0A699GY69_TANCI|nr:hypothetical protein [Tanacetum cinerariifolium]
MPKVKTVNDEVNVQALIDGNKVNTKESSIRRTLKLDDEEGTSCLATDDIFTGLANMGYEKIALMLKPLPGMNLAALWHQQLSVLPQTRSLTSLEHHLPSPSNDPIPDADKDNLKFQKLMDLCIRFSKKVLNLESEVNDIKSSFTARIQKLEDRNMEKSFKHGRMIEDMNKDVEEAQAKAYNLDLQHAEKVLSMQDINKEEPAEVEEVLEVVKAAKLMTEVVTTAQPTTTVAQVLKANASRRRRGVIIQDPKETTASVIVHIELEAELNANIYWNDVIEQVKRSERQDNTVMRYQALKRKPVTEAQARKNIMIYLKNMAGFKMDFFKGMTYSEIRPIFDKHYNSIQAFLEKVEEEVPVQEEEELKRHLQIVANDDNDDVFTKSTPLASKVPIVDYQIHHENNKPYYTIIKADGTHKLFLSFITLLKKFDREDLEALWKLVKERVHVITLTTTQMFLLVEKKYPEKKYPLTHFTLQQMLDNVRLKVEKETEMSLELLRLVIRQLNEGYKPE